MESDISVWQTLGKITSLFPKKNYNQNYYSNLSTTLHQYSASLIKLMFLEFILPSKLIQDPLSHLQSYLFFLLHFILKYSNTSSAIPLLNLNFSGKPRTGLNVLWQDSGCLFLLTANTIRHFPVSCFSVPFLNRLVHPSHSLYIQSL